MCSTCSESIRQNELPSSHILCQTHALHAIPHELTDLTDLEERLNAHTIYANCGTRIQHQVGLKGSVDNVSANLNKVTSVLPRSDLDEHADQHDECFEKDTVLPKSILESLCAATI